MEKAHPGQLQGEKPFVLMVDNYDSFTWNLVDLVRRYLPVKVIRNDELTAREALALKPSAILISPGPGRPGDSGMCPELMQLAAGAIPLLGVCLGCQLLGQWAGAEVVRAQRPMHGKTSLVYHDGAGVFAHLPNPVSVMRYHSLVIAPGSLPLGLEVSAWTAEGEIMGVIHPETGMEGLQFHPESVLTPLGGAMIGRWMQKAGIIQEEELTLTSGRRTG